MGQWVSPLVVWVVVRAPHLRPRPSAILVAPVPEVVLPGLGGVAEEAFWAVPEEHPVAGHSAAVVRQEGRGSDSVVSLLLAAWLRWEAVASAEGAVEVCRVVAQPVWDKSQAEVGQGGIPALPESGPVRTPSASGATLWDGSRSRISPKRTPPAGHRRSIDREDTP